MMRSETILVLMLVLALTGSSTVERFRRKQKNALYKSLWDASNRHSLAKTLWQTQSASRHRESASKTLESVEIEDDSYQGRAEDNQSISPASEKDPELDYTGDDGGSNKTHEITTEMSRRESVDVVTSISVRQTHIDSSISVESRKEEVPKAAPTTATIAGPTVQSDPDTDPDNDHTMTTTENVPKPTNATKQNNTTQATSSDNSTEKSLLELETEEEGTLIFYLGEDTSDHLEQLVQDNVIQVIAQSVSEDLQGYDRPTIEVEGSDTDFNSVDGSGSDPLPAPRYISVHF